MLLPIGEIRELQCPLRLGVPWSEITTLGVGGRAPAVCEPKDDIELRNLLALCKKKNVRFIVLGAGSNIVGCDDDFDGIVIRLSGKSFQEMSFGRDHATVGAGVRLRDLAEAAARKGFTGIAPLAGIPATVGGAIKMNAGADGVSIGNFIEEICGFDSGGNVWKASKSELSFPYRKSSVADDKIIIAAILHLAHGDSAASLDSISKTVEKRSSVKFEGRNAGCVFLNPGDAKAGIILDKAGCKGMSCGKALVSSRHANYFINTGSCPEADFVGLASSARMKVFENSGILLFPEVKFANPRSLEKILSAPRPLDVAVLKGGSSRERDISLISAKYVSDALRAAGMKVSEFDIRTPELPPEAMKCDVVFPVLHGGFGENGEIQGRLERAGLKFVGSSSKSCSLTIDKIESKKIMLENKIPTAPFSAIGKNEEKELAKIAARLGFPLVVKAPLEGSTFGITIVDGMEDLEAALDKTFSFGENVLIEKFISGREITVGILDGKALPPVEIEYPGRTYDFDAKYTHSKGETKYHCPPVHIEGSMQEKARKFAVEFYRATGARDMLRVDFICADGVPYALEGNSIPGFTDSSLLPKAAKTAGISFTELCAGLVMKAYKRR